MAERPSDTERVNDKPQYTGGWRRPEQPGVKQQPKPREAAPSGWRVLTALPPDLESVPQQTGAWHLPRPEDTPFTQEAEAPAQAKPAATAAAPEDMLLMGEVEAAPAEPAAQPLAPEDMILQRPEAAPPATAKTGGDSASDRPVNLLELEDEATGAAAEDEEEDTGGIGMSELIALASLVEQPPKAQILPGAAATGAPPAEGAPGQATGQQAAAEAERAGSQAESYAQEQLRRLQEMGAQPTTGTALAQGDQAESYAQEQLRRLGMGAPDAAAGAAPATPLTPEQQEIANRFRATETEVRALRASLRAGQLNMTRDQLQERLRQLMVLDDNRIWWMMGIETDQWYKHENGQWVPATPPYSAPRQTGPASSAAADFGTFGGLAYPPGGAVDQEYTQPSAAFGTPVPSQVFGTPVDESPLPNANIPVLDPDRTMVGTVGVYASPVRPYEAETVPNLNQAMADTVLNQPMATPADVIPAAGPLSEADVAPDYVRQPPSRSYDEVVRTQRQRLAVNLVRFGLIALAVVLLLGAGGIGLILLQYNNIASGFRTQINALANYRPQFQTARILDANGNLITELNSAEGGARTNVPLSRISPFMIHAVVSLENERFFEDPGWDWIAIGRAFVQNVGAGEVESGASTITQQIARQLVLGTTEVSPQRKLQEIVVASEIAKQYDKNFILQLYLNEIYFGNQNYGVEAASEFYFGHTAEDLNLPEAAMLAGMIAAPATYDPVRRGGEDNIAYGQRRDATFARMEYVIQRMVQVGCLQFQHAPYLGQPFCVTQQTVRDATIDTARVEGRRYEPRDVQFKYPHFVQFVQQIVERDFPGEMFRRGFVIRTTLNPSVQDVAEAALKQQISLLVGTNITTGSIMVTDPRTGAIRAMVGSPNFNDETIDGQVNGALTWQQPGSSIKPIVYTAALEGFTNATTGQVTYFTPATVLWDVPTTFSGNYQPVNFDGRYRGPVAVRYTLQNSLNVPTVKVFAAMGPAKFQDTATRLGLRFPENAPFGLATALGAAEVTLYDMTVAFGTLANDGVRNSLYVIENIADATGAPIQLPERAPAVQAVQPQVAFLIQDILSDDTARADQFGVNGPLTIAGLPTNDYVAAKTGTTDQNRDLWTVGFTSNAVVGVWLGRPDDAPTNVPGGGYAAVAPLWNQVMTQAIRAAGAPQRFDPPQGIVQVQICAETGTLPPPNCRGLRNEIFIANQPPPAADAAFVRQVAIDTWTGLRANENCPDNVITGTFVNIDDPAAIAWLNSPAGAAYRQQLGLDAGTVETIPPAACDLNTDVPIARILSPGDNSSVTGQVTVTGASTATNFNRYQLEVAPASTSNYVIVSGPVTTPQTSGTLGTWNTTTFPNGAYTLRLAMFSNSGGYLYRTVTVNVNNAPPTPTPTLLPTAGLPPQIFPTVPFQPTLGGIGFATPTVTPLPFENVAPPP